MKELGNGRNRHPYRPHPVLSVLTFRCLSFAGGPRYVLSRVTFILTFLTRFHFLLVMNSLTSALVFSLASFRRRPLAGVPMPTARCGKGCGPRDTSYAWPRL